MAQLQIDPDSIYMDFQVHLVERLKCMCCEAAAQWISALCGSHLCAACGVLLTDA